MFLWVFILAFSKVSHHLSVEQWNLHYDIFAHKKLNTRGLAHIFNYFYIKKQI